MGYHLKEEVGVYLCIGHNSLVVIHKPNQISLRKKKNALSISTHVSLVSASASPLPFLVGVRVPLGLLSSLGHTVN